MRTLVWFIYFWGYMLLHLPALRRGLKALEAGVCDEKVLGRELIALIYRMMPGEQTGGDA